MSKNRSLGKQNICGESIKINCSNVYMFINILKRNIKFKTYLFSKIQLVLKNQVLKLSLNILSSDSEPVQKWFSYILTKYIIMTAIKKYIPNIIHFKLQDMKVMDIELIV